MNKTPWIGAAMLLAATSMASAQQASRNAYIVQLAAPPAAGYAGSLPGYAATRPAAGQKFNARAAHVLAYRNLLANRQDSVLAGLGNVPVTHRYSVAFNGFTARLTDAEVARLQGHPDMTRILLPEDWVGWPLRKDSPLGYEEVAFTHNTPGRKVPSPGLTKLAPKKVRYRAQ